MSAHAEKRVAIPDLPNVWLISTRLAKRRIQFSLEVARGERIDFTLDLTGSTNARVVPAATSQSSRDEYALRMVAPPRATTLLGMVAPVDERRRMALVHRFAFDVIVGGGGPTARDLCASPPVILSDGVDDFTQGAADDCAFLAAFLSLPAARKRRLFARRLFAEAAAFAPVLDVELCARGRWARVAVDDAMECAGGLPKFARPAGADATVIFVEKAYARLFGLAAGHAADALAALTGAPVVVWRRDDAGADGESLWDFLAGGVRGGHAVVVSAGGHAVALVDTRCLSGVRYARIRDPRGAARPSAADAVLAGETPLKPGEAWARLEDLYATCSSAASALLRSPAGDPWREARVDLAAGGPAAVYFEVRARTLARAAAHQTAGGPLFDVGVCVAVAATRQVVAASGTSAEARADLAAILEPGAV